MTKRVRKRFFYLLLLLFIVLGASAVLYAQGWRIDFTQFEIGKVGAIYVNASPRDAEVLFEGTPIRKNIGVFDRGVIIGNLFPRHYTLTVKKDSYHSWQMSLEVQPSRITQAEHVVLVPRMHTAIEDEIYRFWIVDHAPLVRLRGGELVFRDHTLAGDTPLGWMEDGSGILTVDTARGRYFWNDLRSGTTTNINSYFTRFGVSPSSLPSSSFLVTPARPEVIAYTSRSIFHIFPETQRVSFLATRTSPLAVAASEEWMAWSTYEERTNTSQVTFYNATQNATSTPVVLPSRTKEISFIDEETVAVLQENGALYLGDTEENNLKSIADGVRFFTATPDGSRIAAVGSEDIEVISLSSSYRYTRIRVPNLTTLENVSWYTDNMHLFLFYKDRVVFLDLLDRDLQNFIAVATTENAHYDKEGNTLYFLDQDGMFSRIDFPE